MNTSATTQPKLAHYGLATADLETMVSWYGQVLGMFVNHRSKIPWIARVTHQGPPFLAFAFLSNDDMDHRLVLFEISGAAIDPEKPHRAAACRVRMRNNRRPAGHLSPPQEFGDCAALGGRSRSGDLDLLRRPRAECSGAFRQ